MGRFRTNIDLRNMKNNQSNDTNEEIEVSPDQSRGVGGPGTAETSRVTKYPE